MKKSNLGLKKENETIPENGENAVFSWNLDQKKLDLEDDINLHKKIHFSCESLREFKRGVGDNIFDALDGNFQSEKKLKSLKSLRDSTLSQKKINNNSNKRKIDRVLLEFQKKRDEERSKKSGIELIKAIQEINDQEKKELDQIGISIGDLEKTQIDLGEQEKFLAVASVLKSSSDNIWKTLLSMPENEAPWVKLNVTGQSYEIKKGEEYKDKDTKLCIKQVIEDKVISDENYDDNYVDFVLSFLLNPFNLGEKYDEETLKYYVYSIIDCIKNTDIVQEIGKLYEKKKEVEEKLAQLGKNLKFSKKTIGKIGEIKNTVGSGKKNLSFANISEFKKSAFVGVLENKKGDDEGLSKEDKENIENFINFTKDSKGLSFEDLFKLTLEDKEDVEDSFFKICDFLGVDYKSEKLKEVIGDMKKLIRDMNNDFIGKKDNLELDDVDRQIENISKIGIKSAVTNPSYLKEWEGIVDHYDGDQNTVVRKLKYIIAEKRKGERIKGKDYGSLYLDFRNFCRKNQFIDIGARRNVINKLYSEIFGFTVEENKTKETDSDKILMKNMLNALVVKINEDRKNKYKIVYDIKTERLGKKQSEENIVENIDNKLRQALSGYFKDFRCRDYYKSIKSLKRELGGLKLKKNLCGTMDEYEKIEEEIKEIENNEYFLELQNIGEVLRRYEESNVVNLSEIDKDYNSLKQLLTLKNLFKCEGLTLKEKFGYSNIILENKTKTKNPEIKSKTGEHDEILVSLFGEENVTRKCKVQEVETYETVNNDNEFRKKEKELLDKLQFSEDKFESFIYELKKLLGFNDSEVELNRLEKKRIPLLRSLDIEKNEQKKLKILKELFPKPENMRLRDLNQKLDKVKNNLKKYKDNTKLKILKELFPKSVNDEQEFRRLKELFPESVVSYIDACISKNELSFGNSLCAINYKTGVFDFSVIKAGILGKAVEEGKITDVLEYLGFKFGEGVDKGEIDNEVENRLTDVSSTIGCIIQGYRQDNVGCFSDDYLTLGEGSVKLFGNYVRSEGNGSKFTIGYKTDKFRFDGKIKDGKFVIERYFSKNKDGEETRHDSHMDYINRG